MEGAKEGREFKGRRAGSNQCEETELEMEAQHCISIVT